MLANEAPWILTVGSSSIDMNKRATAILGNKKEFDGESLPQPKDFTPNFLPSVYPGKNGNTYAARCYPGSLNSTEMKGKAVLCEGPDVRKGQIVKAIGGVASIFKNNEVQGYTMFDEAYVLPATVVSFGNGQAIKAYINSTPFPKTKIVFKGTILGVKSVPEVAFYSSRGPNLANPGILKPDIISTAHNILVTWPYSAENSTNSTSTSTSSTFFLIFGTLVYVLISVALQPY
ncbi:hypothetical protein ACH5RR_022962 [Cinchona calisaya]|uniref:PA domain-containing protein n=1 Tax=Cinchona calisaya TaxID=153742 RepID=A0ABD2ZCQ2_9GENT